MDFIVGNRYMIVNDEEWNNTELFFIGSSKNEGFHGYFEYYRGYFHLNEPTYNCARIPASKQIIDYDAQIAEENKQKKLKEIADRKLELETQEAALLQNN